MDGNGKVDKRMMETFSERLKFDALSHHVILYMERRGFEYNYQTEKVRPFDSILWYPLEHREDCRPFIDYLKREIEAEIDLFEQDGYPEDCSMIGLCTDGYLIIDLEDTLDFLHDDNLETLQAVKYSYIDFYSYLNYLYKVNEEVMKDIIEKQSVIYL